VIYDDFLLQLEADGDGRVSVRASSSLGGEAGGGFELDRLGLDPESWFRWLGQNARGALRGAERLPLPQSLVRGPEGLGQQLFDAVFQGELRACFERSLIRVDGLPGRGLRLRLQLPADGVLGVVPWELLFSREHGGFLAQQRGLPIVRHPRLLQAGRPEAAAETLRLLVVGSAPAGLPPLELVREAQALNRAFAPVPGAEIEILERAGFEDLRQALLARPAHVLHFMGHGGTDARGERGQLYFVDAQGAEVPISAELVATLCRSVPSLRFVFLNACESGRPFAGGPLRGVATAILASGVAAVVGMQVRVPDEVAILFSRVVYGRLAQGDPIEAAVAEGRLQLAAQRLGSLAWAIPVLFLRSGDGQLASPQPVRLPAGPATPSRRALIWGLIGLLTTGGVSLWTWGRGTSLSPSEPDLTPDKPSEQRSDPEPPKPEAQPEPKPKPPAPAPLVFTGSVGADPVRAGGLPAELSARFFERDGGRFVRFQLLPEDGPALESPTLLESNRGTHVLGTGAKRWELVVSSIEWEARTARVRLRRLG
jgi:hypothetical protein